MSTVQADAYVDWVGVLANPLVPGTNWLSALVHLFWVDTILGMQILHLTVGEDSVELAVCLELVTKL